MKVILTKDVDTVGEIGDVLDVSDGYARNYLFSQQLAVKATEGSLKDRDARLERIRQQADKKHQAAQERADKVSAVGSITIEANAAEDGRLYGAITTKELAKVLEEKSGLALERKQINLSDPMNKVGKYTLFVKFTSKVTAEVQAIVKASESGEQPLFDEELGFTNDVVPEPPAHSNEFDA